MSLGLVVVRRQAGAAVLAGASSSASRQGRAAQGLQRRVQRAQVQHARAEERSSWRRRCSRQAAASDGQLCSARAAALAAVRSVQEGQGVGQHLGVRSTQHSSSMQQLVGDQVQHAR